MIPSVSNSGGGNVAFGVSTLYNGVGNAAQTWNFTAGASNDFFAEFNGIATSSSLRYNTGGSSTPDRACLPYFMEQIPELAGNMSAGRAEQYRRRDRPKVRSTSSSTTSLPGSAVPDLVEWSNSNRRRTMSPVPFGCWLSSVTFRRPKAICRWSSTAVCLGVGTDVLTTGGMTISGTRNPQNSRLDSQIFAEGGGPHGEGRELRRDRQYGWRTGQCRRQLPPRRPPRIQRYVWTHHLAKPACQYSFASDFAGLQRGPSNAATEH